VLASTVSGIRWVGGVHSSRAGGGGKGGGVWCWLVGYVAGLGWGMWGKGGGGTAVLMHKLKAHP